MVVAFSVQARPKPRNYSKNIYTKHQKKQIQRQHKKYFQHPKLNKRIANFCGSNK